MVDDWTLEQVQAWAWRIEMTPPEEWRRTDMEAAVEVLAFLVRSGAERQYEVDELKREMEDLGAMQERQAATISRLLEENDLLRAKLLLVARQGEDGLG